MRLIHRRQRLRAGRPPSPPRRRPTFKSDAFTNDYALTYHRDASWIDGPLSVFFDRWSTQGLSASDDLATARNRLGFGTYFERQTLTGNHTVPDAAGNSVLEDNAPASRADDAYFLRDTFTPIERLSFVLDAWYDKATTDPQGHLDPRASLIYRPSTADMIRLTAGRSAEEPSLQLDQVSLTPVGALNPDCGAIKLATPADPAALNVGTGPASGLRAEKASDVELSYEHHFTSGSSFALTAYDMNLIDRIVTANLAAGSLLPASTTVSVLNRISTFCGITPNPAALQYTLTQAFNAATAKGRGLEISGHVHVSPHLTLSYAYDIQSLIDNDLPSTVLSSDPTLVNGIQAFQVPLHKASLGIDFSTNSGFEGRVDGHFVSINNPQQLPGYAYADASLSQRVSPRLAFNLGVSNVFNSHVSIYNQVGCGVPYPTNAENAALSAPFLQPFNAQYGLMPMSIMLDAKITL